MENLEIHPGVGVGELRFGMEREEVDSLLGEPEQIEEHVLDGEKTIAWYFWSRGFTAYFEERHGFRLASLQVDDPAAQVRGKHFIGAPLPQLVAQLADLDWGDVEVDDDPEWPSVGLDALALTFHFDQDAVDSIQLSPLLDENEEEIWPPSA